MGNNQSNRSFPIEGTSRWVEFENDWFSTGCSRRVYRGTYHGEKQVEGMKCVVRVYKDEWSQKLGELAYRADIRSSERAQEMAKMFTTMYPSTLNIEFVRPEIARINTSAAFKLFGFIRIPKRVKGEVFGSTASSTEMIHKDARVVIEKYLEGQYVLFLSNTAYQNEEVPDIVPAAFSHFTFHHSHGEILVCDLKGVRLKQGYVLTDPSIHSRTGNGHFGPTDLGAFGMIKFFQNHQCSEICNEFVRPDPENVRPRANDEAAAIQDSSASTYMHQLRRHSVISVGTLYGE